MFKLLVAGAAMVAAVVTGSPAVAATYIYTVTGTVNAAHSADDLNLFDAADLATSTFEASFILDDSFPRSSYTYGSNGSSATGGGMTGPNSVPPLVGTLTLNGVTYSIRSGNSVSQPGDPVGESLLEQDGGSAVKDAAGRTLSLSASYSYRYSCCEAAITASTSDDLLDFTLAAAALRNPDYRQQGVFQLGAGSTGFFQRSDTMTSRSGQTINFSTLYLLPTQLTVINAAVPEPASWGLMILGLGMVGGVARRRTMVTQRA